MNDEEKEKTVKFRRYEPLSLQDQAVSMYNPLIPLPTLPDPNTVNTNLVFESDHGAVTTHVTPEFIAKHGMQYGEVLQRQLQEKIFAEIARHIVVETETSPEGQGFKVRAYLRMEEK